ncbi:MAG TPA: acetate/propionate family kinase [Gemmata sp.]|jgi:acetate kinase|nr:acetate/propionate family kinase [Gemmata sp.]
MLDAILVLNAGSSSLKFSAFQVERGERRLLAHGQVEGIGSSPRFILHSSANEKLEDQTLAANTSFDHQQALNLVLERCTARFSDHLLVAVGHRVVHGGMKLTQPMAIDRDVLLEIERLVPLAPLQQPHNLAAIKAAMVAMPTLPQVACFDTAFHRTQPEIAQWFGLPRRFTEEGLRRYGFHGLSYEYIASMLPTLDARAATGRTIVAHLGSGASMCALLGGKSVATTMSFTPVDGLVMGTRVGSLDPAAMLYLMVQHGMDARALEKLIYHESGLLGVSGISSDMRDLLSSGDPRAAEAIELFVYRIAREIGSLTAALGGLDALVFTGGIGENAPAIRERVCRSIHWLGVELDETANLQGGPKISSTESVKTVWVIPTNEESIIAEHTQRVLGLS